MGSGFQNQPQVEELLKGNTELIESYYTHSYSLFEGKDTDQNYTTEETHRVESERFQV